jgi:nitrate/nitrite transport system permease protein
MAATVIRNVVPPLVVLAILLAVWQVLCSSPTASLPSPHKVWQESYDLIAYPFFNYGSQDIGLGWRVLISLQRVAYGFGLAAIVGVCWSAPSSASRSGRCAASTRSSRCCAPCRRSPGCRCRSPPSRTANPSAIFVIFITSIWPVIINTAVGVRNIPQDYRNVAKVLRLNQIEFFFKIMLPSAAPYIFTGLRIGVGLSGWPSSQPKC